ncbi:MAG: hypothetical protein LC732_01930 [Acidobacteria bacterium]|nr:hypothetical protein [Acidobacteriota bacterium]
MPFDLVPAELCGCIARERTFVCPQCGCCACSASLGQRNEFWATAPPVLRDRRRLEQGESLLRLQSLDPATLPRPFALIVDDDPLVLTVAGKVGVRAGKATFHGAVPPEPGSFPVSLRQ